MGSFSILLALRMRLASSSAVSYTHLRVVDGRLYGRGAQDDKGPAVAALYAMRCIKELGLPLGKTVRLVLGTDEECGSSDLPHYYAKEEEAPVTISPDADGGRGDHGI